MAQSVKESACELYATIRRIQARILAIQSPKVLNGIYSALGEELTFAQMSTMGAIHEVGQVSIKELAGLMGVSAPSASVMVDRLVELGAVTREHSRHDRREVCVNLSAEGLRVVEELLEAVHQSIVEIMEGIGPEMTAQWCEVYGRIHEILDEVDGAGLEVNGKERRGREVV